MVYPVSVKDVEDIKRFSEVASEQDFTLYIRCGNSTFDLRSFLSLFVLLGQNGVIIAPDHVNPKAFVKALKRMGLWD